MNQGWIYREQVDRTGAGQTVLAYYSQRYRHSPPEVWRDRLAAQQIWLDGQPTTAETRLELGQNLAYHRPPWQEPDVPLAWDVLYEDADLLVIAKPSGLPVMPAGGFLDNTLLGQLRQRYPNDTPVPIHRLGRGTSGLVLLARSPLARSDLTKQMRDRQIRKIYWAIASGQAPQDSFRIDRPIGKLPHPTLGHIYGALPASAPGSLPASTFAQSDCRVLKRGVDRMVLEVTILTGRPHQIRIHLGAAGFPLVGDPLYGPGGLPRSANPTGDRRSGPLPGDGGYHLHAHTLSFRHPRTPETLSLVCPPPSPFLQFSSI